MIYGVRVSRGLERFLSPDPPIATRINMETFLKRLLREGSALLPAIFARPIDKLVDSVGVVDLLGKRVKCVRFLGRDKETLVSRLINGRSLLDIIMKKEEL